MTTVVPMPLTLPRFTTDEAEEIWLSTNGGGLDSVSSNLSDFGVVTPTTNSNWCDPALINCSDDNANEENNNEKFVDDAKWLANADLGDEIGVIADTEIATDDVVEEIPLLAHPINCDWNDIMGMPELDDVEGNSADENDGKIIEEDIPIAKRSKKVSAEVSVSSEQKPPQMPDKLLQEARKSTRTRKTKTTANGVEKKKKTPRRRRAKGESKTKKKSTPADPTTAKRKREERLRRNRESANRSRIRKKKEMQDLKQDVVILRQKVVTLSNRIEELEESNQGLRERLAMYKKTQNSFKPAVTVFALVFTVAFFAQPSTVPQLGLAQIPAQGASKVMNGLGKFGQGSKTFLLAPIVDLFSNNALDAVLSTPGLSTFIGIVTRIFIAIVLAGICAVCFHYFGSLRCRNERKKWSHVPRVSFPRKRILESV